MNNGRDICVVGDLMLECIGEFPDEKATRVLDTHDLPMGGPNINLAWHLACLGLDPRLVGTCARKDWPLLERALNGQAIDVSGLELREERSDLLVVLCDESLHKSVYIRSMIDASAASRILADCRASSCVILNGSRHEAMRSGFCRIAGAASITTLAFNPSYAIFTYSVEEFTAIAEIAAVVTLNEVEIEQARKLMRVTGVEELSRRLRGWLVCTYEDRGADIWREGSRRLHVPSLSKRKGNFLGAGDAFLAGFISELLAEKFVSEAAHFAAGFATFVVESGKIRPSTSESMVRERLRQRGGLVG